MYTQKYKELTISATSYNRKVSIELPCDSELSEVVDAFEALMVGFDIAWTVGKMKLWNGVKCLRCKNSETRRIWSFILIVIRSWKMNLCNIKCKMLRID